MCPGRTGYEIEIGFLTGWDAALVPMILIGCDGGTNATSGIVPEITRKLYELTIAQRFNEACELQYKLLTLFDTMFYAADFPEGFRAALGLRGFKVGGGRQPLTDEQKIDLDLVTRSLQCVLAEQGFAEEPVGGCRAGDVAIDPEEVTRIVRSVVTELRRRRLE